jgi:hypothetical protein
MTLQEEAVLIARGLHGRFVTPSEASTWADRWIARLGDPPPALFEVSLGSGLQEPVLVDYLAPLIQAASSEALVPETLGLMARCLERDPSRAWNIAEALWQMKQAGTLPEPLKQHLGSIRFILEDATAGI